ncbi:hypothetical protein SAMN05444166_4461 [Singulisphaera sp. GP187]|uniref:hypothetical protein n=1 Tax=Singulisphaera sp. GP187 TaxID=1882752 RepID=UPI000927D4A2|nr:hypothetical protein [Singulisphaera sp. GP187]SIO40848.1 hypothetical protein SAMN05444166_4461 [Singulisphaera sp. GP187]
MKTFRNFRGRLMMIVMTLFFPAGCSLEEDDPRAREPISGTVTFDGEPLKDGTIQLQPATQKEGVAAGGMVSDGHFAIPRAEGPVPGKYTVAIYAAASPTTSGSAEQASPTAPTPRTRKSIASLRGVIPTRYNIESELTAEVKPGGPNSYAFNLKK